MASKSSIGYNSMDVLLQRKRQCTEKILEIKRAKKLTWEGIAEAVGRSPVWVTACCLGEASMDEPAAQKLVEYLGETNCEIKQIIMQPGIKAQVPVGVLVQDPCIYRLQEVTLVYGNTIKELIQEKFGDGIMSAIDFKMEVEKEEDPAGDRVRIVMSGKYLPYKRW
ncbi:Cyanate hydratase [Orchesella cincta]|uniref:Cyanate hydratase n=1 Tax=Orchesella cincta TaxID=48709 RepID=A0A1D2N9E5_ORCCI|nr:Cyanate hydratase [Orchesella cincta]